METRKYQWLPGAEGGGARKDEYVEHRGFWGQ